MKRSKYILIGVILLCMSSCAEFFEFVEILERTILDAQYTVRLSHKRADLLVGDSLFFDVETIPDSIETTYRWYLTDTTNKSVSLIGKRLYARTEGEAMVYVQALPIGMTAGDIVPDSAVIDSCYITVSQRIEVPITEFPYETIVIATLQIADTLVTDTAVASRLTALVDGEIRGRAKVCQAFGIDYLLLRIGGRKACGEEVTIDYYDRDLRRRHVFTSFTFDGETHGTLSDPVMFLIEEPRMTDEWEIEGGKGEELTH